PEGANLALREVCRWSEDAQPAMEPYADLVLMRLGDTSGVRRISVDQIKDALHDAGVNLSIIRFSGAAKCAVYVGDATPMSPLDAATTQPAQDSVADAPAPSPSPIIADAAQTALKDLL